ncbi:MAG: low molecular weight phosphotyrosine protein phosphatase [Acidobacteria bacterium]|nr:low molecular weight phosphotyrosine protein phosphatase [Acidobacteriota bacterium]
MPTRVLFVCLGNICRSPAAEAAFAHAIELAGRTAEFEIDSAGTGRWHVGEPADERMRLAAARRGLALASVARQIEAGDFERFDYILAMDQQNLRVLAERAPARHRAQVRLFRDFDPEDAGADVPDPYYGGPDGFDEVLDIVTRTSRVLLETLAGLPGVPDTGPTRAETAAESSPETGAPDAVSLPGGGRARGPRGPG